MFQIIIALANFIGNPIAFFFLIQHEGEDLPWRCIGWIILMGATNPYFRSGIVAVGIGLFELGCGGVGAFGIVGGLLLAVLYSLVIFIGMYVILITMWFWGVYVLGIAGFSFWEQRKLGL